MTQKQFSEACKLQKEIKSLQQNIEQLQKIINELKEGNEYRDIQDIKIQLNDQWVATPTGIVNCSDLLSFLIDQRDKLNNKINDLEKEFAKL